MKLPVKPALKQLCVFQNKKEEMINMLTNLLACIVLALILMGVSKLLNMKMKNRILNLNVVYQDKIKGTKDTHSLSIIEALKIVVKNTLDRNSNATYEFRKTPLVKDEKK